MLWGTLPELVIIDAQTRKQQESLCFLCCLELRICSFDRSLDIVVQTFPNCSLLLGILPEDVEKHQSNFHNSCETQRLLSRTNLAPVGYLSPTELHYTSLQMQILDCSEPSKQCYEWIDGIRRDWVKTPFVWCARKKKECLLWLS